MLINDTNVYFKNRLNFFIFRDVCEILLEAEADVDHCDKLGRTPLWAAASMGHPACVSLLLFWGCYVDSIDNEGRTVLSVSAAQGNNYVVSQLLDRGTFLFCSSFVNVLIYLRLGNNCKQKQCDTSL